MVLDMNYQVAKSTFAKARKNRSGGVNLERNTFLEKRSEKVYAIRLHDTDIVTFTPTYIELDSGGWNTKTTSARMSNHVPFGIASLKDIGWCVCLVSDELACYCTRGENPTPGKSEHFTGEWTGEPYMSGSVPIYELVTCSQCNGTLKYTGVDWSNAHPYFDGIRVSNDGKRLLTRQPRKPKRQYPVFTQSGW